jgi:hypothetical protein
MKKSRVAAIFAALSLSAGIAIVGSGSADAAKGDEHFIKIATHGAPLWKAKATQFDGSGKEVKYWDVGQAIMKSGGERTWDFTDGGDGGWINIEVEGFDDPEALSKRLPLNKDSCFLVGASGLSKYTGDNETGGCTRD